MQLPGIARPNDAYRLRFTNELRTDEIKLCDVGRLGVRVKGLGNAENESYGIEKGHCYADSPVVVLEPYVDVPRDSIAYQPTTLPGARLPNIYFADGARLHDKLGPWFSLLAFD